LQNKGGKMAKESVNQKIDTIIGPGAELEGNISVRGSARCDGRLKGKVRVQGTFVLGKTGLMDGELEAKNAVIGGTLKGTIKIEERIEFETGARFIGDLVCKILSVQEGVLFDGTCTMTKTQEKIEKKENKATK